MNRVYTLLEFYFFPFQTLLL